MKISISKFKKFGMHMKLKLVLYDLFYFHRVI